MAARYSTALVEAAKIERSRASDAAARAGAGRARLES